MLYITGKHLRVFAIKADESAQAIGEDGAFSNGGLQEDIAGGSKNEKLEDAARVINRMFTLCISDRYVETNRMSLFIVLRDHLLSACCRAPLEESRKWGLYYITNLLFKTYFKVSILISIDLNLCRLKL